MVELKQINYMSAAAFNNVVDTQDDNVYCVQGVAVPGARIEGISFAPNPATATSFIAPADGWVCLLGTATSANTTWYLYNTSTKLQKRDYLGTNSVFADYIRAGKGDVIAIYMNLGAVEECAFVYDK